MSGSYVLGQSIGGPYLKYEDGVRVGEVKEIEEATKFIDINNCLELLEKFNTSGYGIFTERGAVDINLWQADKDIEKLTKRKKKLMDLSIELSA